VTWRDGVHLTGTAIWCDALRARDVCFVSRADAVTAARHGQLCATAETLALLGGGDRGRQPASVLPVPYARPFTLGTRRIELFRSGAGLGGASLLVDVDGMRVVYAGATDPRGGGLGGSADVRTCDTVILDAELAAPGVAFEPTEHVIAALVEHVSATLRAGNTAVLLLGSPVRGLDVANALAAADVPVAAHRSIGQAARRAGRPPLPLHSPSRPRALLWPVGARENLSKLALPATTSVSLISGRALSEPGLTGAVGAERAFAWTCHSSADELAAYVEACGARTIYFTHRHAETMAARLDGGGRVARPLGPPMQMQLFE
jgi:Cft2 family RNA processing exonuclease